MKITLEYNARNRTAARIIDIIMSMDDVFKVKEASDAARLTREAMKEAERGDVVVCDSYEDYLKRTGGNA